MRRPSDANEPSGRPMRRSCARSAAAALNFPKPTAWASKQATISPSERAWRVTCRPSRADRVAGAARRPRFIRGARKLERPSSLGMQRIELAFRQRPVSPSELDRDFVKPARCEAAIEMPQSRNDHSGDWDLDGGARRIEDEEIEARALGQFHAGGHLFARVEIAELRSKVRSDGRSAARHQIGMVLQPKWRNVVLVRFLARRVRVPAAHEPDGQKLVELRHRAQRGNSRIEMGAGAKLDKFLRVLRPVCYRNEARNPEVAGDVEHPKAPSGFAKLDF